MRKIYKKRELLLLLRNNRFTKIAPKSSLELWLLQNDGPYSSIAQWKIRHLKIALNWWKIWPENYPLCFKVDLIQAKVKEPWNVIKCDLESFKSPIRPGDNLPLCVQCVAQTQKSSLRSADLWHKSWNCGFWSHLKREEASFEKRPMGVLC